MKVNPHAVEDITHEAWLGDPQTERDMGKWIWKAYVRGVNETHKTVIIAESMEPEIGSELDKDDWTKVNKWKADPQVHYAVCATVDAAKQWLDGRLDACASEVTGDSEWVQGSVGHALPGFEVVGETGASSIRRTVTYANEFGTHEHWQQIKVEFVEGAS